MSTESLPDYFRPDEQECGESLGISVDNYRGLAKAVLAIIKGLRLTIGLYRLKDGCAVDIFGESQCLTIAINSAENQVSLFSCHMDGTKVFCLLRVANSETGWSQIRDFAREEVTA
jgi:hypothetical protein